MKPKISKKVCKPDKSNAWYDHFKINSALFKNLATFLICKCNGNTIRALARYVTAAFLKLNFFKKFINFFCVSWARFYSWVFHNKSINSFCTQIMLQLNNKKVSLSRKNAAQVLNLKIDIKSYLCEVELDMT